jgi:hypothetical protein
MKSNKKQRNEILTQAYWRGLLAKHRALFVSFAERKGVLSCLKTLNGGYGRRRRSMGRSSGRKAREVGHPRF